MLMRRSYESARPHFEMGHYRGIRYQVKFHWKFWEPLAMDLGGSPVRFGWYVEWDENHPNTLARWTLHGGPIYTVEDTSKRGIAVQIFDADGKPIEDVVQCNTDTGECVVLERDEIGKIQHNTDWQIKKKTEQHKAPLKVIPINPMVKITQRASPPPPKSKPTYAYIKPNGQVVTVTPSPMDDLTTYMLISQACQPAESPKPSPVAPSPLAEPQDKIVPFDPTPSYRSEVSSGSDFSSDYSDSSDSSSSSFGD